MKGCSIRAIWVVNASNSVVFSRRFPTVDRRWHAAFRKQKVTLESLQRSLPSDVQIEKSLAYRKSRGGAHQISGLRDKDTLPNSDAWVDDPITRHIISLQISGTEDESGSEALLWPLVYHAKGNFQILVLPLVEPHHLNTYASIYRGRTCGGSCQYQYEDHLQCHNLSMILLDLPCITGACVIAKTIGDIITGDMNEPDVLPSTAPTGGGLLDSITVGIAIAARTKPITVYAQPQPAVAAATGSATTTVASGKTSLKAADKDFLGYYIASSMPFGVPLDVTAATITSMKSNGFSFPDMPPINQPQPAWKPYLYKGRQQKLLFTVSEVVSAALYDRDDIMDTIALAGQVNCRAELEGLPDVSLPLNYLNSTKFDSFSYHPCCPAQAFDQGQDKQTIMFSPPLGNFVLVQYHALSFNMKPPVQGFYQLSMVSENEGAFLFKLRLLEAYKSPFVMEYCTITISSPRRKILSLDGNPSIGTLSAFENLLEWKLVISARPLLKSTEVTFPGTIKFGQITTTSAAKGQQLMVDSYNDDFDLNNDPTAEKNQAQDMLQERMTVEDLKLGAVDLNEPFCWDAYSYAKVSFKLAGGSMSGLSIDPKTIGIYPALKVPSEVSAQVLSGDYILWNSLGRYPNVASGKST